MERKKKGEAIDEMVDSWFEQRQSENEEFKCWAHVLTSAVK